MQTTVVVFPFDLFGGGGSGAGAELLADELRTILKDNAREQTPTRALAYTDNVRLRSFAFEKLDDYRDWRRRGRLAVRKVLARGDFLLWLAGNHLGVLPLYDELAGRGDDTLVVQFDAHLDVHQFSGYSPEPSHGNFLLHCAGPLPPLVNVGHRELLLRQEDITPHFRQTFAAAQLATDPDAAVAALRERCRRAEHVFLDLDCDVLDAAFFPATDRSVPFGLSPLLLLRLLDAVWSERVRGVAVSEFAPHRDRDDQSLATLTWLAEYLLLRWYEA